MKKLFVLGSGIGYSLSPTIFARLFEIFGEKGEYSIVDLPFDKLRDIRNIAADADGFNVTKPFKTEIVKYLDDIKSDCGSVNTVTVKDMTGYSTDGKGFLFDLCRNFPDAEKSNVLIIGYGGAASACVSALIKSGANIAVTGRDSVKVADFAKKFGVKVYDRTFVPDGVVACTTGTYVPDVKKVGFCYDLRYFGEMLKLDCPSVGGLGMLIAQAIYSYEIFCGKEFDNDEINGLYLKIKEML